MWNINKCDIRVKQKGMIKQQPNLFETVMEKIIHLQKDLKYNSCKDYFLAIIDWSIFSIDFEHVEQHCDNLGSFVLYQPWKYWIKRKVGYYINLRIILRQWTRMSYLYYEIKIF